jgi:hypothetical protein
MSADPSTTPTEASTADLLAHDPTRDPTHRDVPLCAHCEGYRNPDASVRGSYCSHACYLRDRGRKALRRIESDHTTCATCFRTLKEIERPPEGYEVTVEGPRGRDDESLTKNCLVGYQYPTEHMELAVDDFADDPHKRTERTRWGCVCGNVDPAARDDILDGVDLQATILNLLATLRRLDRTDAIDKRPSWPRMQEALRTHGRDWPYVVGATLYDH